MLVAYRDGFADSKGAVLPWKSLTASTSVDVMVEDAYSVTVVCMTPNGMVTWQSSRTVGEDTSDTVKEPTLQTPCSAAAPPATVAVTGTAVKAGTIHLGDQSTPESSAANTPFSLLVPTGKYDLIASDPADKKALIQRNIMVNGAKDLGNIDASTGVPLTSVMLTLDNPPPAPDPTDPEDTNTETVEARVVVASANNSAPGEVFFAGYDLDNKNVNAFAYPTASLLSDDIQSAVFVGTNQPPMTMVKTTRMQTRPLDDKAASGMTTFQLPALITDPGWGLDTQNRLTSVALPSLPALDTLTVSTSGTSINGTTPATYQITITSKFFQKTGLARPVFDTDLAGGFPNDAKIDFKKDYSRDIVSQHNLLNKAKAVIGHETSMFHEEVPAP